MDKFTVAIYANGASLELIRLEEDLSAEASAEALANGYSYAGTLGLVGEDPVVQVAPGYAAVMVVAGAAFAEMLGPWLQQQQLQRLSLAGMMVV